MSKHGLPNYSWDTSVFIAWINEEKTAPLLAMELVSREIDAGKATLVVSALVIPEVLDAKMTSEQREKFNLFLQRSNVVVADVTVPIATKARQIRDRGLGETPKRKIKTPDATVLATAILFKCDALHSLRTMFVVVAMVAIIVAYHVNWIHQRHLLVARGWGPGGIGLLQFNKSNNLADTPNLLKLLGEDTYIFVQVWFQVPAEETIDRRFNEAEIAELRAIERSFPEAGVHGHLFHAPDSLVSAPQL